MQATELFKIMHILRGMSHGLGKMVGVFCGGSPNRLTRHIDSGESNGTEEAVLAWGDSVLLRWMTEDGYGAGQTHTESAPPGLERHVTVSAAAVHRHL